LVPELLIYYLLLLVPFLNILSSLVGEVEISAAAAALAA
jgi:hypothetical protein